MTARPRDLPERGSVAMRTERIWGGDGVEVRAASMSASEVHQERLERARTLIVEG